MQIYVKQYPNNTVRSPQGQQSCRRKIEVEVSIASTCVLSAYPTLIQCQYPRFRL